MGRLKAALPNLVPLFSGNGEHRRSPRTGGVRWGSCSRLRMSSGAMAGYLELASVWVSRKRPVLTPLQLMIGNR
jgi:hypothetical protein